MGGKCSGKGQHERILYCLSTDFSSVFETPFNFRYLSCSHTSTPASFTSVLHTITRMIFWKLRYAQVTLINTSKIPISLTLKISISEVAPVVLGILAPRHSGSSVCVCGGGVSGLILHFFDTCSFYSNHLHLSVHGKAMFFFQKASTRLSLSQDAPLSLHSPHPSLFPVNSS